MKTFRGFLSVTLLFFILVGGSHPPVNPGSPIDDLVARILGDALDFQCKDVPAKSFKKDLVGTWEMSLVSIVPPPPISIPLVDPIKKSSTWKIIDAGKLQISYDNTNKWYSEPLFLSFTAGVPSASPNSARTTCTFKGNGVSKEIKEIPFTGYSNIIITYDDTISVTMQSDDIVTATIGVNLGGKFTEKGRENPIKSFETVTYKGIRK